MAAGSAHPVLLYDGVCGLCNRLVQFVLKRDRHDQFCFASLQSGLARQVLARHGIDSADLNTVYLVAGFGSDDERLLSKSRAIREILVRLGGIWKMAAAAALGVPERVLDATYDWVARHRYRIFGRYTSCSLPDPRHSAKFLDI